MKIPRPTAQMNATTPWSTLGGRGGWIIAGDGSRGGGRRAQERGRARWTNKVAEPVAVSSTPPADFPLRPLRGATYDHPVVLRPTPAPRSAHEATYGLARPGARGRNRENVAICGR